MLAFSNRLCIAKSIEHPQRMPASVKKRYLVTAALPYANGPLHIGHLAGAYLPADIYTRYQRLMGREILFVCGSDEHGAAITMRARKEGVSPREIVDKYHVLIRDTFQKLGIAFDIYHRTSEPLHHQTSQDIFRKLLEKGHFEERETEQYYDEIAGQFLADRYILGTCPMCGNPDAYGDQCEKCGASLSPDQLLQPRSALSGATPIKRLTTHWYFKLNEHEAWLREWINTGQLDGKQLHDPATWKAHVVGQCNSWLDQGLQPRAMTRDLDWGVDVPPEIPHAEGKKLYVWLDAPIGYISATKQWATEHYDNWERFWKSDETALIHFIGKDNIVFHCLIFPAILRAHGEFILPINVPANQFLNLEGAKLSTSRNWAVWAHEYLEDLPGREDELRYNLIKNMPEQRDSEFTWKGLQETTNTELVANLGGFIQRVFVLLHKNYGGLVPQANWEQIFRSGWDAEQYITIDRELFALAKKLEAMGAEVERFQFRDALRTLMEISSAGNALLQFNEPWKATPERVEEVRAVLFTAIQYAVALSVAMRPFLPFAAARLRAQLNLLPFEDGGELVALINDLLEGNPVLWPNHPVGLPEHLFSRLTDEVVEKQIQKLHTAQPPTPAEAPPSSDSAYPPLKKTIPYEVFEQLDLRVATVVDAQKVEKADKLLRLTVDLGFETRTIVAGIAQHYTPEQVVGRQVLVVANLAPRKMRGIESQGMILMAEDAQGHLCFVRPDEGWPHGFSVR